MAVPFIAKPELVEIVDTFADWISRLFRVNVIITVDNLNGIEHTVEIGHPDKGAGLTEIIKKKAS